MQNRKLEEICVHKIEIDRRWMENKREYIWPRRTRKESLLCEKQVNEQSFVPIE